MRIGLSDTPTPYFPNGADVDDACSAFLQAKAQRALERKFIQVFLSHKQKDYKAADQIRDVLRINSAGRIKRALLERAVVEDDMAAFARVLADLDPNNVEFISLAARRLGELVRADAHTGAGQ